MLDPYRMIVVNLILSSVLICGLFFYKFVLKRKVNLLFLLILISILPVVSIFRNGVYESGDFNIHIYRLISFYDSLKEGNIMPSWAGGLNATYGYPLFIFNYTFPYYILSIIHFFGFGFINSMKIFLSLSYVLSGFFMYLYAKNLFKNNLAAFCASIFYLFAPYHLIDLHFKVTIGEIIFFTFLPLVFLFLHKMQEKKTLLYTFISGLFFAFLLMSHIVIGFFAGILLLLRFLSKLTLISFLIALLISLYFWLGPAILTKYSFIQNITLKSVYFPTLQDLLYSPFRLGLLFQGPKGEISHLLGYSHIFVIIFVAFLLYKKIFSKKIKSQVVFWFISSIIIIYFVSAFSKPIWELLPIIKTTGSHRLLILASFTSSILAGYFTLFVKKAWFIYIFIGITIGQTILNWGHRRVIPEINGSILQKNLWKSTAQGEAHFYANTRWVDVNNPWFAKLPQKHLEVKRGLGEIKSIIRTSTYHKYIVDAKTPLEIQENTLYFPGWKALINDKIQSISPNNKGLISSKIPKGIYNLELFYEDVLFYKVIKIISFTGFSFSIIYIFYLLFKKLV